MNLLMELGIGNGARPYNYNLSITMPTQLGISYISDLYMNTLVYSTQMPGMRLNTREFWVDGHSLKLPGTMTQDQTWRATFYLDDNYYARAKIEAWMYLMDNYYLHEAPDTGGTMLEGIASSIMNFFKKPSLSSSNNPPAANTDDQKNIYGLTTSILKQYGFGSSSVTNTAQALTASITITQQSYGGSDIMSCTMYNAFPIEISAIEFNDNAVDSLGEFTVTFAYSHHVTKKPGSILSGAKKFLGL